ncbi:MAG: FxsA family protein [Planctomycetota bacterium]|nr:FxsA family protein [Planctomycetota bacterium]
MFIYLLLLFITIPMLEVYLLLLVSGYIGPFYTFCTVIVTAILGSHHVRQQGLKTLFNAKKEAASGQVPTQSIVDGVFILISGLLLLTPGFLTDFIGFAFLIPPVRRAIAHSVWQSLKDKITVSTMSPGQMAGTFMTGAASQAATQFMNGPGPGPGFAGPENAGPQSAPNPPMPRPAAQPGEIIIDAASVKRVDDEEKPEPPSSMGGA